MNFRACFPALLGTCVWTGALFAEVCGSSVCLAPRVSRELTDPFTMNWNEASLREQIRSGTAPVKVYVIVPVYRELSNGNFFDLLECFSKQSAASENFQLILVINNRPEVKTQAPDIFKGNQDTLHLARYVSGEGEQWPDLYFPITKAQETIIEEARKRKMALRVLDLTTGGTSKNIGSIFRLGTQLLERQYLKNGKDSIVALMEADTIVPPEYVENIEVHFLTRHLSSLVINMDVRVKGEASVEILKSFHYRRFEISNSYLNFLLPHFLEDLGFAGTPMLTCRMSVLEAVGGIPGVDSAVDQALSSKLLEEGHLGWAYDTEIRTLDRMAPDRFAQDGRGDYTTPSSMPFIPRSAGNEYLFQAYGYLYAVFCKEFKSHPVDAALWIKMKILFRAFGVAFDRGKFDQAARNFVAYQERKKREKMDEIRRKNTERRDQQSRALSNVQQWLVYEWHENLTGFLPFYFDQIEPPFQVGGMFDFVLRHLSGEEAHILLKHWKKKKEAHDTLREAVVEAARQIFENFQQTKTLLGGIDNPEVKEFFRLNPWLEPKVLEFLTELPVAQRNFDDIQSLLTGEFPDWLVPFEQTPFARSAAKNFALSYLLQEADANWEHFPQTHRLLDILEQSVRFPYHAFATPEEALELRRMGERVKASSA